MKSIENETPQNDIGNFWDGILNDDVVEDQPLINTQGINKQVEEAIESNPKVAQEVAKDVPDSPMKTEVKQLNDSNPNNDEVKDEAIKQTPVQEKQGMLNKLKDADSIEGLFNFVDSYKPEKDADFKSFVDNLEDEAVSPKAKETLAKYNQVMQNYPPEIANLLSDKIRNTFTTFGKGKIAQAGNLGNRFNDAIELLNAEEGRAITKREKDYYTDKISKVLDNHEGLLKNSRGLDLQNPETRNYFEEKFGHDWVKNQDRQNLNKSLRNRNIEIAKNAYKYLDKSSDKSKYDLVNDLINGRIDPAEVFRMPSTLTKDGRKVPTQTLNRRQAAFDALKELKTNNEIRKYLQSRFNDLVDVSEYWKIPKEDLLTNIRKQIAGIGMLGPRVEKAIEENPEQILEDPKMPEEAKEEAAQVLDSDNRTDEANNEQVEGAVEKLSEDFDTVDDLYNYLDQFGDEYGLPDNKTFDEGQMISESNPPVDDGVTDYDYSGIPDPDILSQEEVQQIAFDSIQSDETLDDTTKDQLLDDVASEIDWLVGLGKAKPKANEESSQEWIDKASKADAYMMSGASADEALDMINLEDEISSNMPFDPNILFGENNVDVVEESIEQEPDPERKARKLRLAEYFKSRATDVGGSGVEAVTQAPTTPEDRRRSVGGSFGGFKPIMSSLGLGYISGSSTGTTPTQPKQQEITRSVSSGRSNLLDRGTGSESTIKAGSVGAKSSSGNMTFNGGLFGSGSTQKSSKLSRGSVRLPSGGGHTASVGGGKLAKGKETLSGRKSTGDINIDKLISMIVSDSKNWPVNDAGNKDSEDRFNPFKLQITKENQILVKGSGLRGTHFESAIQKNPELLKVIKAYFAV